jgi:Holliday junction resolvase RusA-like endonuclease
LIELEVIGTPASQGPKTAIAGKAGGRPFVIDGGSTTARKKLKSWRQAVSETASAYLRENPQGPLSEPLAITMSFRFDSPASDRFRSRHSQKPDLDHLIRSTADALVSAGLLKDDNLIWKVSATKSYVRDETTGATILIFPHGKFEAEDRELLKREAKEKRTSLRK